VETPVTAAHGRYAIMTVAAAVLALIGALALTGKPPGSHDLQHFEANGIIAAQPLHVGWVEIRTGNDRIEFRRKETGSWAFYPSTDELPSELASHLEAALRFMHVSTPARTLDPSDYQRASFADFGLDPPAYLVSFGITDGSRLIANFGTLNPAGTSQYVRLVGQSTLYLMPRHVGAEWQLTVDMAKRILPREPGDDHDATARATGLLLPTSIDQLGAVELVTGAKLHRFERDGSGNWFLHLGQHVHSGNTPAHVADPAQGRIIAAALAALDRTQIEGVVARHPSDSELDRYGLSRPMLIALTYARDSSAPLARIEFGNKADDNFSRYARTSDGGNVVRIAAYEAERLIELLKAVGAGS
jgi:hypothetical protein